MQTVATIQSVTCCIVLLFVFNTCSRDSLERSTDTDGMILGRRCSVRMELVSWSGRNIGSILQVETTQTVFLKPVLSFFKTFLLVKLWHAASVGAEDGATATLLCLWTRVELNLEEGERQRCHPSVKRLANKSRQSRGRREGKERTRGEIWRAKG